MFQSKVTAYWRLSIVLLAVAAIMGEIGVTLCILLKDMLSAQMGFVHYNDVRWMQTISMYSFLALSLCVNSLVLAVSAKNSIELAIKEQNRLYQEDQDNWRQMLDDYKQGR